MLVVTELIANAARHTPCHEIRMIIVRPTATRVRVGIIDREPSRLPTLGQARDADESGRGLLLVDAVADRWGYHPLGPGTCPHAKEVWGRTVHQGRRVSVTTMTRPHLPHIAALRPRQQAPGDCALCSRQPRANS
ncbi:ATP-binding protein [Streptomyces sp. NPDC005017]|uniref:ATP-binding protein n=1 Tax=Streptomyces sp. NPDC005017 TaxID=3364706 RepID=UPI003683FFFD